MRLHLREIWAHIHELDPRAKLEYSTFTSRFFVSSRIADGSIPGMLIRIAAEYRADPVEAVHAYWDRLTSSQRLVIDAMSEKHREVVWNPVHHKWADLSGSVLPFRPRGPCDCGVEEYGSKAAHALNCATRGRIT